MSSETSGRDLRANGHSNEDDVTKSRTRVSRACTRCRTRKDRCDGLRPACTACINAQQTCYYEPSTKKRGLPEGYVRGLEKLLALLMGKIEGFEVVTSSLLKDNHSQLSKIWNDPVVGEELHTIWKDSRIVTELDSLLSSLDQSSHFTGHKRKRDKDDDGALEDSEPYAAFHISSEYQLSSFPEDARAPLSKDEVLPNKPLPLRALQLLDQYFAHTNCWFPILRRPDLTRACYELARGSATSTSQAMAPLLWAVFSFASRQTKLSATDKDEPSPEEMHQISLSLLPVNAEACTLIHAQAILVLSLNEMGNGAWKSAWLLVGKAIRILLTSMPDRRFQDKRVLATLQGCVILDVATASHLCCVPHLRKHDLEGISPLAEDGHEEWEPWNGSDGFRGQREPSFSISCFNRFMEISLIICEILTMQPYSQAIDKHHVQKLLAKLHELQTTFPGQMPPSTHSPPHQIYLQLYHVSAQMRLVELPIDTGAGSRERARLACNVLSLLALCKNAPSIGLTRVPPFSFDAFAAAIRLAGQCQDSFSLENGLPSYDEFCQTAREYTADLSSIWSSFRKLGEADLASNMSQTPVMLPNSLPGNILTKGGFKSSDWEDNQGTSFRAHIAPPAAHQQGLSQSLAGDAIFDDWDLPPDSNIAASLANVECGAMFHSTISNDGGKLTAQFPKDGAAPHSTGNVQIDASPSFRGDEIDAIFHEMAHLDTNDWTTDRATDLKDFGFNDDLTFQAFCNDPNRLTGVDDNGRTLSSSLQTWMFTSDAG